MALPTNWYLMGGKAYPAKARATARLMEPGSPADLPPPPKDVGLRLRGHGLVPQDDHLGRPARARARARPRHGRLLRRGLRERRLGRPATRATSSAGRSTSSGALRKGKNLVAVKVSAPALAFDLAQQFPVSWPKQQNQVKGIFGYHDTRPGATSMRGQERGTGGILRGIGLRASSGVDLVELKVTPLDVSAASARLVVEAVTRNWGKKPVDADARRARSAPRTSPGRAQPARLVRRQGGARPLAQRRARSSSTSPRCGGRGTTASPTSTRSTPTSARAARRAGAARSTLDAKVVTFGVRSIARDDRVGRPPQRPAHLRARQQLHRDAVALAGRPRVLREGSASSSWART